MYILLPYARKISSSEFMVSVRVSVRDLFLQVQYSKKKKNLEHFLA